MGKRKALDFFTVESFLEYANYRNSEMLKKLA